VHEIDVAPINHGSKTSTVTFSSHAASYASAGWFEANIEVESPWVGASVKASGSSTTRSASSGDQTFVTGRYSFTRCRLTLPDELKPHPAFQRAIETALKCDGDDARREALKRVFGEYGFFYLAGAEMGATMFVNSKRKTASSVSASPHTHARARPCG
jgi:hypothetical protein